ncbi:hypothetical protein EKS21_02380 [Streptococcus mutans]|nr:hypothetical protein [Streptococcus mutans]
MNVKNQVLRKLVRLHNLVNVNQLDYINVSKHSMVHTMECFFDGFLAKFTPLFTPNSHHYFLRLRKAISPTAIGITFEVLT